MKECPKQWVLYTKRLHGKKNTLLDSKGDSRALKERRLLLLLFGMMWSLSSSCHSESFAKKQGVFCTWPFGAAPWSRETPNTDWLELSMHSFHMTSPKQILKSWSILESNWFLIYKRSFAVRNLHSCQAWKRSISWLEFPGLRVFLKLMFLRKK